jgi:hypothetical protein
MALILSVKPLPFLATWTAYKTTGPEDGVQANVALFPSTSTAASADELIRAQALMTASAKRAKAGIFEGPSLYRWTAAPIQATACATGKQRKPPSPRDCLVFAESLRHEVTAITEGCLFRRNPGSTRGPYGV